MVRSMNAMVSARGTAAGGQGGSCPNGEAAVVGEGLGDHGGREVARGCGGNWNGGRHGVTMFILEGWAIAMPVQAAGSTLRGMRRIKTMNMEQ